MKSHSGEQVNSLGSCCPVKGMSYERNVIASARIISSFDFKHRTAFIGHTFIGHTFIGHTFIGHTQKPIAKNNQNKL